MRLVKFLSAAGVASRRNAEKLIAEGKIFVNGAIISDPARDVLASDEVEWAGVRITLPSEDDLIYLVLNKPVGVNSTMSAGSEIGLCLTDLVQVPQRIHPIGRLDRDSCGLLLLTNDGQLTYRLTHPSFHVEKVYSIKFVKPLHPRQLDLIAKGVDVDGRKVIIDELVILNNKKISLTIHEGRKRIIRRMCGKIGLNVAELRRLRIGPVAVGKLAEGKWRKLKASEIVLLKQAAGLN